MEQDFSKRHGMPHKDEQHTLIGIVILDKMIQKKRAFLTSLEGDDTHLEDVLDFLSSHGVLDIDVESAQYVVTPKGKSLYETFLKKYKEYLRIYDVFCAVDLGAGEFGFEKLFDYQADVFQQYIHEERFQDLRVTVCEFKKMNPIEVIFISFLMEKRFREPKDRTMVLGEKSWQFGLVYGEIFREILDICNRSLHFEELGYQDELGKVSGEAVIRDVVEQGYKLSREIHMHRLELQKEAEAEEREQRLKDLEPVSQTTTVSEYEAYYSPYSDPYYRSPLWDLALLAIIL